MANTDTDDETNNGPVIINIPKGGLFGGAYNSSGLDSNTKAVVMDFRWVIDQGTKQPASVLTYYFPTSVSDYTVVANYPSESLLTTFQPLNDYEKRAVLTGLNQVSSYTNLKFNEAKSGQASDAALRFIAYNDDGSEARFPANDGIYAPGDAREAGDNFIGKNGQLNTYQFFGTDNYNTIIHEMGHSFGLKHGHDDTYNGALSPDRNDNEFSVMTYASYFGADTSGATEAILGSAPQSWMMYDIAALQAYYGANFSKVGTTAIYKWDANGQQWLNGQIAPDTGTTATKKIFSTIWTAGADATYDFSNFNESGSYDLRPGYWSRFSSAQLADLNNQVSAGTPTYQAQGNIYNSLLYNGDTRSAVSTLITGNGDNNITGNEISNIITIGNGNNKIDGGKGFDVVKILNSTGELNSSKTDAGFNIAIKFGDNIITNFITNVERFLSPTSSVAFDIDANAGQAYRIYQAAFDRKPDTEGLGYWISQLDKGTALHSVANGFIGSSEFQSRYGVAPTVELYVDNLYKNVLHRAGEQDGVDYWVNQLKSGVDRASVLVGFSESAENKAGLIGAIQDGIYYKEWLA